MSDAQSCAICGDDDWQWLYLLLNAPRWVQERAWFASWFIVTCESCHQAWDSEDALRARWKMSDEHHDSAAVPDFAEYRRVIAAMQSEPPLPRATAVAG